MNQSFLRRLAAVGLLLCLALGLVPCASAEEIDLSALSDTQLTDLLFRVNTEIVDRRIEKTAKLPAGKYIAGRDFPCGRYIYVCLATGSDWGNLTVKADNGSGKLLLWEVVTAPKEGEEPDTYSITLNEGDCLDSAVPFSLTIPAGVFFW